MIAGVADKAYCHLVSLRRCASLRGGGKLIDRAAAGGDQIVISSISLAEIIYLSEKGRLPPNAYEEVKAALDDPDHVFKEAAFTGDIVDAMRQITRTDVPDMPE